MHGLVTSLFLADLAIPNAGQCFRVAAPVLALIGAWWMIARMDQVIDKLFPSWEWEKRLGWLNIGVERRADTVLRWIGHAVHALLAAALYGILWGASFPSDLSRTNDPSSTAQGMSKLSTLLLCLGVWVLYLGWELIPKLRNEYEREELEKYRAELDDLEEDPAVNPSSRLATTDFSSWKKMAPRPQLGRRR